MAEDGMPQTSTARSGLVATCLLNCAETPTVLKFPQAGAGGCVEAKEEEMEET